jgi:heptosyltransferase-2
VKESRQADVVVCGANWLGDAVMSMPALHRWREEHREARLILLSKPGLIDLWRLAPDVDACLPLQTGLRGAWVAARRLRDTGARRAVIVPNSFRAALPPWLAGVPERVGFAGHWRRAMLTRVVHAPRAGRTAPPHQSVEVAALFGYPPDTALPPPRLNLSGVDLSRFKVLDEPGLRLAALLPGAARGPSKRWPAEHFAAVGRRLADALDCRILVLGAPAEQALCEHVAQAVGSPAALCLAGKTSLPELAGILGRCLVAVTNDSGGMHLATACATPVVAVFGITDPARTGPLGPACRVVQAHGVRASRDVPRDCERAHSALAAIHADTVAAAAVDLVGASNPPD